MFNSIGWAEILVLLVVALFIFGPDRLPSMAKDAAGAMQKVRGYVTGARNQIREEFGDDFADIDLRSLNPREFVRRQLLEDDPPPLLKRSNGSRPSRVSTTKPAATAGPTSPSVTGPAPSSPPAGSETPTPSYDDAT